jgi:hypothetical protein
LTISRATEIVSRGGYRCRASNTTHQLSCFHIGIAASRSGDAFRWWIDFLKTLDSRHIAVSAHTNVPLAHAPP